MLKRNTIIKFVLVAIIAVLGILLCVCPFSVPYSTDNYNGIIPAINKGVELNGGISAIYECSLSNGSSNGLTDAVDSSLEKIERMLETEKFDELYVSRQGGNKVYVLASGKYANEGNSAFDFIAKAENLSFTAISVEDNENPEIFADSSVIYKAYADYDYEAEAYGVKIEFTSNGSKKLKELKDYANSLSNDKVYLYLGEISTGNILAEVDVDDLGGDSLFITGSTSGSYKTSTAEEARSVAYTLVGGSFDVELKLLETSRISPVFGKNTNLYLSIALASIVVAVFVCLLIRYRHLGLLAILALTFYMILFAFFMMALPFITLNIAGVVGSVVAFFIATLAIVFIYEKIKDEYALGKKIHLSCKGGFKRALWTVLDSHFIIIIISLFMWIFAPSILKGFGIALILGALLSMFTSLVVLRIFVRDYLRINSTKAKKMALYRDKSMKEVKDEEVEIIKEEVTIEPVEGGSHE